MTSDEVVVDGAAIDVAGLCNNDADGAAVVVVAVVDDDDAALVDTDVDDDSVDEDFLRLSINRLTYR